jgi:hypothetical protein
VRGRKGGSCGPAEGEDRPDLRRCAARPAEGNEGGRRESSVVCAACAERGGFSGCRYFGSAQGRRGTPRDTVGNRLLSRVKATRLGCGPRASARGNPRGRAQETRLGCSPRASARGSPWGGRGKHGWEPLALAGQGNAAGMQPSAKAEGKPRGEGAGNTVGMQPSRKREGKPGGAREARLGCSPRASARGSPWGGRGKHGWDAALAQARGEARGEGAGSTVGMQPSRKREGKPAGRAREARLGCSPRASARGSPRRGRGKHGWDAALAQARGEARGEGAGNTVGMQPSRKREGKSAGCESGHGWDAAAAQGRRETRWQGRGEARRRGCGGAWPGTVRRLGSEQNGRDAARWASCAELRLRRDARGRLRGARARRRRGARATSTRRSATSGKARACDAGRDRSRRRASSAEAPGPRRSTAR